MTRKFDTSFNFGANVKPKKKAEKGKGKKKAAGAKKSNAWRAYTGGR